MRALNLIFICILTAFLLFSGCKEEELIGDLPVTEQSIDYDPDILRTSFAQNLAMSLGNKELRDFLKAEAVKQFDGDYDILFNLVKNKVVTEDGKTFFELLQSNWKGELSLALIVQQLPTLNILIPFLMSAPVELWDTQDHIPLVAVLNSEQHQLGIDYVKAYNIDGREQRLPAFEEPSEVTIVVQTSERIQVIGSDENNKKARVEVNEDWVPLFKEGQNQYYITSKSFLSKSNYTSTAKHTTRSNNYEDLVVPGISNQQQSNMWWAFVNTGNTSLGYAEYMREGLYYGSKGDNPLNTNISDKLQLFRFRNLVAAGRAADGWIESNLELHCYVMHGGPNSQSFNKVLLTLSVPRLLVEITSNQYESLDEFLNNVQPAYRTYYADAAAYYKSIGLLVENRDGVISTRASHGLWMNWGGNILNWSIHRYGDRLNFKFLEHDDGSDITVEKSYSVGFDISIGIKDKFNIGLNNDVSGKTSITYKNNSDQLGEYTVEYYQKYFVMEPPISLGDIQFILATY